MADRRWTRVLAVVVALLVQGCGVSPKGGRMDYHFALSGEIKGFDPALSNDVPNSRVLGALFEGLLQYHYLDRPYRVIPALAEAMPTVSEDLLTYTFKIKPGVLYHDDPCFEGKRRALKAGDFVFAWKRLADVKTQATGWWVLDGWIQGLNEWRDQGKEGAGSDYAAVVEGLQAPDDQTLVVKLTKPYPQFLYVLTMTFTVPLAEEAVRFYGAEFLNHPVGTGPYQLKEFTPNSRVVLDRFPDFRPETYPTSGSAWAKENGMLADAGKTLPFLDRITYKIIVEPQPAWLEFRRGNLDRAAIPKDNFDAVMDNPRQLGKALVDAGVKLQIWPSQTQWWVAVNMADPVLGHLEPEAPHLKDELREIHKTALAERKKLVPTMTNEKALLVRRAIAWSHDARKFLEVMQNGRGEPADAVFPPMLAAYDAAGIKTRYGYDPEKAKGLLAEAGFPGGKGLPVLSFDIRGSGSLSRQIAEFLKRGMEDIGFQVELVSNTWPEFLRKANMGRLQVYWGGWVGDYPDEENWMQLLYGPNGTPGPNYSNYANPEYDELYRKTRIMADSPERREMLLAMNEMVMRDCPWRMSFVSTDYVLHHRWLKNFMYADPIYNWQKYLRVDLEDRARGLPAL